MTTVDMHLLFLSLKAIERVCTQERYAQSNKKASHKGKKGNKRPGTGSMGMVPKKACTKKHCNLYKKYGGTYTTHNTKFCHRYEKDGSEKSNFCTAKKGAKKPNPTKQSFMQLSEKMDRLEKAIKKQDATWTKNCHSNCDSDSE
jgi:hypothetical protein